MSPQFVVRQGGLFSVKPTVSHILGLFLISIAYQTSNLQQCLHYRVGFSPTNNLYAHRFSYIGPDFNRLLGFKLCLFLISIAYQTSNPPQFIVRQGGLFSGNYLYASYIGSISDINRLLDFKLFVGPAEMSSCFVVHQGGLFSTTQYCFSYLLGLFLISIAYQTSNFQAGLQQCLFGQLIAKMDFSPGNYLYAHRFSYIGPISDINRLLDLKSFGGPAAMSPYFVVRLSGLFPANYLYAHHFLFLISMPYY